MLRLLAMTAFGLWASLMVFGRDLSPEEQAALEMRRAEKVSVFAQLSDTLSESFGSGAKRQGAYVPTLAEAQTARSVSTPTAPAHDTARIHLASTQPEEVDLSGITRVSHPEKMAAILSATPAAPAPSALNTGTADPASGMVLREVTASRVNVRSGPSTANPVLGQLVRSEIVRVISPEENGWVKILVEGAGVEGYMAAEFLADLTH
ncbi:SH3 domain-containing protein [Celeribacter halophilus]|uniref:SH3 domain-containing protein n=1 Tax=Celeribacter halophilus TaxID=576117 RepID=UPI003A8FB513